MAHLATHYRTIPARAGRCKPEKGWRVMEMRLNPREVRRLSGNACGTQIVCTGGALWVTQQGDPEDYYLRAGERFTVARPGTVVIQGMRDR